MSRPLRIEFPGAWYHVMNRGRRGERIYADEPDFQAFVDLIKDASQMWQVKVSSYCLMSNHYHMLITTPLGNLSRFMRHVDGVYSQTFNRRHRCDGPLFKGRFKSILVDGDSYLLQLVRYIHRNPLRAKIVEDLNDYPWNSHIGYLSKSNTWDWLHKEFILAILSENKSQRMRFYRDFVLQEDSKEVTDLFNEARWPTVWGGSDFIDWVKGKFFKQRIHKDIPDSIELAPDIGAIIGEVCDDYGIGEEELKKSRRGRTNEPRDVAIYLIRMLRGDTLEEIGQAFSLNRFSSVSSIFQKMKVRLKKDKLLHQKVENIEIKILKKGQT